MLKSIPDPDQPRKKIPAFVKILAVLILICFPVGLLWMILTPIVKSRLEKPRQYSLPSHFSQADLFRLTEQLKSDPEYYFYFKNLSTFLVSRAVREVFVTTKWSQGKTGLRERIRRMQSDLEQSAGRINLLPLPEGFVENPLKYPEVVQLAWEFLYEEFKLAMTGVCYQLLYDPSFFFVWGQDAHQAAYQVHKAISSLQKNGREQAEEFFLQHEKSAPAALP